MLPGPLCSLRESPHGEEERIEPELVGSRFPNPHAPYHLSLFYISGYDGFGSPPPTNFVAAHTTLTHGCTDIATNQKTKHFLRLLGGGPHIKFYSEDMLAIRPVVN